MSRKSSTTSSASSSTPTEPTPAARTFAARNLSDDTLERFNTVLSSVCLDEMPDLGGLILGNLLKSKREHPDMDSATILEVLMNVGNSIHAWRCEVNDPEMGNFCPCCDNAN